MITSGCFLAISPSSVPISPSRQSARTEFRQHFDAGFELRRHIVQHHLHDVRHAGHDDDVADPKTWRRRNLVEHQLGAGRHARHAHARFVHHAAGFGNALLHHRDGFRVRTDCHAERLGDGVGGDVVVGRADAAGGEHVSVARAQRVERRDDVGLLVGDDADFLEIDADIGEVFGDIADVLVLGPAREDFVADDEDRGGDDAGLVFGLVLTLGSAIGIKTPS